ncbi:zinc finger protein 185 [Tautogolabrus adspersus]
MSKDKTEVFRTTKVRTRLRDDGSWLQRRGEHDDEKEEEEKPCHLNGQNQVSVYPNRLAEVRASRVNGAPNETSPVSSPTKPNPPPTPPPTNSETQSAPKPGYLIRGIFTKLDKPPINSPSTNGPSGTTQFTKKPSESYKKIAPYTMKPTLESQESQLSPEEKEKRTEAASNVLRNSAGRQRSYVLSAAKKFEYVSHVTLLILILMLFLTKADEPDTSPSKCVIMDLHAWLQSCRVEITDDDERAATSAPASSPPPSSVAPVTSVASAPKPKLRTPVNSGVKKAVDATYNKPVAPKVEEKEAAPEPAKEDPRPVSVPEKDPFEGMKPGCTKVATPLPKYIPEPEEIKYAVQDETPLVDLTPAAVPLLPTPLSPTAAPAVPLSPTPVSPTPAPAVPLSPTPVSPTPALAVPLSPTPVSPTPAPAVPLSPTPLSPTPAPAVPLSPTPVSPSPAPAVPLSPTPVSPSPVSPVPLLPVPVSAVTEITVKTKQDPEPEPSPKPSSRVDTLSTLSDTLISFNTSSSSLKDNEPDLAKEEGGSADTHTAEEGDEEEPTPAISNSIPTTDDLLSLTEGPGESAEPVPPSPGRWSQYLLSGPDSESKPAKSNGTLDLLPNDVIIMNSEARSLSTQPEEEKPTDETAKETQSSTETVTVTTKTVIITDKSEEDSTDPWSSHVKTTTVTESRSADPFDPYPIGTTSPNSSSDLLQPLSNISINRVSTTSIENKDPSEDTPNALESLADDVIPINTEVKSLSTRRSWTRTWDTSTQQTYTEERDEAIPKGQAEDQNTTVMFERKSKENDSPWDRWTSPTVYTTTYSKGQEDEEEEEEEEERNTGGGLRMRQCCRTIENRAHLVNKSQALQCCESERSASYTYKNCKDLVHWIASSLLTATAYSKKSNTACLALPSREIHSEPEPAMDRYDTYSRTVIEEEQRVQTPEPETKKGFVYLKEYINSTEMSLHNARDTPDGGSDYLTSRSANYSYSSPPSVTLSSTCNYCGKLVGNDAKISIEHLNINCHPACFKCGVCDKPMGDLLFSMFLHEGKVHCESCYSTALD